MRYAAFVFWVMAQVLALVAFAPVHAQMPAPRAAAQAPAAQGPAAQGPAAQAPAAPAKDKPAAKAATETAPTAASAPAAAPPSPDLSRVGETLDKANAALNDIEATLDRHNLNDADLVAARQLIAPIANSVSAAADKVTPRLTEIKARLDQLGAPPDDKSPPESPSVTDERTAQQQSFSNADELLKRAKLLSVRAEQMKTNIAARRRTLFATSLFQRSTSIADASLWRDVWREAPGNIDDVGKLFSDWAARINARFDGLSRLAFWLGLPAILLAYIPFARFSLHLFARSATLERPSLISQDPRRVVGGSGHRHSSDRLDLSDDLWARRRQSHQLAHSDGVQCCQRRRRPHRRDPWPCARPARADAAELAVAAGQRRRRCRPRPHRRKRRRHPADNAIL